LIDVDVGINHKKNIQISGKTESIQIPLKIPKIRYQSTSTFFLSNIISLRKVKRKKPGFYFENNLIASDRFKMK
jgi:hypothetical protein